MKKIFISDIYNIEMPYPEELLPKLVIVKDLKKYQYFDVVNIEKFNFISSINSSLVKDKVNLVLLKDFNKSMSAKSIFVGTNGMNREEVDKLLRDLDEKDLKEISSDYNLNKIQKITRIRSNSKTTKLIDELDEECNFLILGTNKYWFEEEQDTFYEVYLIISYSSKNTIEEKEITMTDIKKGNLSYLLYYIGNLLWNSKTRSFIFDKSVLYLKNPYPIKCQLSYQHYHDGNDKYEAYSVGETKNYQVIGIKLFEVSKAQKRYMYNDFTPKACFFSMYKFKYGPDAIEK